ncbi:hypothetical protein M0638_04725 [Roseomonas sp. NAR14]|uniref:Lipoprotein n=1 Tax=Roseomonas acroporae TaxID=2937791 RepID=A0A9X1Y5Z2_9PROT|nr:hypothetical protein [Roseomonas acroporae]MCK8783685.1 hypothetical protein [Roseomonas acroporae]
MRRGLFALLLPLLAAACGGGVTQGTPSERCEANFSPLGPGGTASTTQPATRGC